MDEKESLSNLDSNRAKGSEELIGKIIDKSYRIEDLLDATRKSWVFSAREVGEISPGRYVALKVLKPGQEPRRKKQFAKEAKTLADLESHPQIATVYGGGRDEKYFYIAMEKVPGDNFEQRVGNGETFSLERIVSLSHSLAEAVDFCHSHGIEHNDIKLKNLKEKEGKDGVCAVLDFGSKFTRDKDSDDVYAMGKVLEELLKHPENPGQSVPKRLTQIVVKAKRGDYENPGEFKKALEDFRRWIPRRKLLKVGVGVAAALGGLSYGGVKYTSYKKKERKILIERDRYLNSMDYTVDEIDQTEASDYEKIDPLFKELAFRIFDQKIRWLIEEEKIQREGFPFATEDGSWFLTEEGLGYWTEGFWPGILWNAYEFTGKDEFKDWATEWTRDIDFIDRDTDSIDTIRFYYSHAKAFESELTGDPFFRDQALRAADFMASRFNGVGNYIQMGGPINQNPISQTVDINSTKTLPLIWFAFETSEDSEDKERYYNMAYEHLQTVLKYNIRDDYSVRGLASFNPEEGLLVSEGNYFGYDPNSCHSRSQARAIQGFTLAYEKTRDPDFLLTAERLANYFIERLPEDFVPFYDFDDPNENISKDSSAAAMASLSLLDLYGITGNERYKIASHEILKSLSSQNYLSTGLRDYEGLIMHGCYNQREGYPDSSLIFGDHSFLEALIKL